MKKISTLALMCALAAMTAFTMFSCGDPETEPDPGSGPVPGEATQRYKTVPYTGSATRSGELENLVFTDYDDEHNYYFFVLGHVTTAPLAYRPAIYYNGTTPITVGYSATNVTESSISNSVTEANEHSVSKNSSFGNTNEIGVSVGVEGGPPFAKFKMEASYNHSWTSTEEEGTTSSRSTSNTYETSSAKASEITDEITVTIGGAGEPTGLYRFALFSTTDVYFIVITDRAKTEIVSAEVAYCARPIQFWALDYDPSQSGTFGKTGAGDLLQIPDITITDLPDIAECEHEWNPWLASVIATAATEGEETRTCRLCGRTETRAVPVLRTGTFDLHTGRWVEGSGNATFSSGMLTANDGARIIVVGDKNNRTNNTITVNGNAFITLKDVNITGPDGKSPIKLGSGANVTIRPEGSNAVYADGYGASIGAGAAAGIQTTGATLTIDGPGSLTAYGTQGWPGGGSAGIGGNGGIYNNGPGGAGGAGGTVIIKSGTVTARGGFGVAMTLSGVYLYPGSGAGIGGGGGSLSVGDNNDGAKGGGGGNITIHYGANVTAIGGANPDAGSTTIGAAYGGGGGGGSQRGSNGAQGDPAVIDDRRNP